MEIANLLLHLLHDFRPALFARADVRRTPDVFHALRWSEAFWSFGLAGRLGHNRRASKGVEDQEGVGSLEDRRRGAVVPWIVGMEIANLLLSILLHDHWTPVCSEEELRCCLLLLLLSDVVGR